VAAAGVGAGLGNALGAVLGPTSLLKNQSLGNIGANAAVAAGTLIANAATRSALTGSSFGNNLSAAIPYTVGQIIADTVLGAVAGTRGDGATLRDIGKIDNDVAAAKGTTTGETAAAAVTLISGSSTGGITASSDATRASGKNYQGDTIVVIGDRHIHDLLRRMSDYQFSLYYNAIGDETASNRAHRAAHAALTQNDPNSPYWRSSFVYDSPLLQSLKTQQRMPWESYSYGGREYTSVAAAEAAGVPTISNIPSAASTYQARRDQAFLDSIGTGAFGLGPIAYVGGANPENIGLSNELDIALGGLAVGGALRSGGRVTLPGTSNAAPLEYQQYWPSNRGFVYSINQTLSPGTLVDRYGFEGGTFVAPYGTSYGARALDYGSSSKPYHVYEVLQPLTVRAGPATPWFGQPGMGTQYELPASIDALKASQKIRRK